MKPLFLLCLILTAGCASTGDTRLANAEEAASRGETQISGEALNHYLASRIYQRLGNEEKAIEELREAADLAPESIRLQIRLLGIYYANQDFENAEVVAKRALDIDPDSVILNLWLGQIYYRLDELDMADEMFRKTIELDPDSTAGYEALAELEQESNDLVAAIDTYQKLVDMKPDSVLFRQRLGLNLLDLNDYDGAAAEFEKVLELDPDAVQAYHLLGAIYLELGRLDEALSTLQELVRREPNFLPGQMNLSAAYAQLNRFDEALAIMEAIAQSPQAETQHHVRRLFLQLRVDDLEDASEAVAPSGAPIVGSLLQALVRKKVGEPYREKIAELDAIESDLDLECNLYVNGLISLFGDEVAGEYLVDQMQALRDEDIESRVVDIVLGRALLSMDRDEEAERVFLATAERYGADKWLHYYLATIYDNLDRPEETEKHLRACLEEDPTDPDVMNFLGYFLAEEDRNLSEAEDLLTRALEQDPENAFYLDSLGWIYYRQGKAEEALEYIQRAIRLMNGDDAVLRDHLGDAYLLNGETTKAIQQWRRVKRLDPTLEGVDEKIREHAGNLDQ